MTRILILILILSTISLACYSQMNNETMSRIINKEAIEVEGRPGNWQLVYGKRLLYVITDESANRMRVFTPVIEEENITEDQLKRMLEANFHSALDAKYSLYEGLVITVYTHPLKELQTEQFIDAMRQVVTLADTFGGSYSSTGVIFNPGGSETETEEDLKEDRTNKKPKGKKEEKGKT